MLVAPQQPPPHARHAAPAAPVSSSGYRDHGPSWCHPAATNRSLRRLRAVWRCPETVLSEHPSISAASAWLRSSPYTRRTASLCCGGRALTSRQMSRPIISSSGVGLLGSSGASTGSHSTARLFGLRKVRLWPPLFHNERRRARRWSIATVYVGARLRTRP